MLVLVWSGGAAAGLRRVWVVIGVAGGTSTHSAWAVDLLWVRVMEVFHAAQRSSSSSRDDMAAAAQAVSGAALGNGWWIH